MTNACGVDFGTSNSTVGWSRPGQPALLALEDGKATLPSAVFFNAEEDEVSFGRAALADYLAGYEGRLMRSLKSLLGTSLIDGQNGRVRYAHRCGEKSVVQSTTAVAEGNGAQSAPYAC